MTSGLWEFAVTFYARPGVEPALLRLQDNGANVCLLICGVWLGQRGVPFDASQAGVLRHLATHWEAQVVRPLRTVRQAWKADAIEDSELAGLRTRLKALEQDAEAVLIRRLEAAASDWSSQERESTGAWLQGLAPVSYSQDALHALRALVQAMT